VVGAGDAGAGVTAIGAGCAFTGVEGWGAVTGTDCGGEFTSGCCTGEGVLCTAGAGTMKLKLVVRDNPGAVALTVIR
jgi:hypothetical protein